MLPSFLFNQGQLARRQCGIQASWHHPVSFAVSRSPNVNLTVSRRCLYSARAIPWGNSGGMQGGEPPIPLPRSLTLSLGNLHCSGLVVLVRCSRTAYLCQRACHAGGRMSSGRYGRPLRACSCSVSGVDQRRDDRRLAGLDRWPAWASCTKHAFNLIRLDTNLSHTSTGTRNPNVNRLWTLCSNPAR